MLPWVSWQREQLADEEHPYAREYMDCTTCKQSQPSYVRARWACGWIPESRHTARMYPRIGMAPDCEECPGYLVQLPEVLEAARALSWKQDGVLRDFYEEPVTQAAKDCIDVVNTEIKAVERHSLRVAREGARG